VYTAYSATLLSHIAVAKPAVLPFSNLFELAKLSNWDAGCNKNDLFEVTASVIYFSNKMVYQSSKVTFENFMQYFSLANMCSGTSE